MAKIANPHNLAVGDEVVVGGMISGKFVPLQHNSREYPDHPCRGRIVSIGTKWVKVSTNDGVWPCMFACETERRYLALPVAEAKKLYRAALEACGRRTKAFINKAVSEL